MRGAYTDKLQDALAKNHSIVMGCHCSVRYSGRAESFLDYGDHLIIIKSDNTLLIHQSTGNAPVNYMKPGTTYTITEKINYLHLYAHHPHLREHMDIKIKDIYFMNNHKLEQAGNIVLEGTEKDMSDMIYDQPELIEQGFKTVNREEQTHYGFVDVLGYDHDGVLTVIECKRYTADFNAVDQLRRYVEKIQQSKGIPKIRGIIAAPRISPNALKMVQDYGFHYVQVHPPKRHEKFNKAQTKLDTF